MFIALPVIFLYFRSYNLIAKYVLIATVNQNVAPAEIEAALITEIYIIDF